MSISDLVGILVGLATIYFLWQQNKIFKQQNEIFTAQAGMEKMPPEPASIRLKRYWPMFAMAALTILTWAAVGFDVYDRHHSGVSTNAGGPKPEEIIATTVVAGWGTDIDPATGKQQRNLGMVELIVASVGPMAKNYNIILLARAENNIVDPIKDPHIDKSVAFTITPGQHDLRVRLSNETKAQLDQSHVLFLYVVALPHRIYP